MKTSAEKAPEQSRVSAVFAACAAAVPQLFSTICIGFTLTTVPMMVARRIAVQATESSSGRNLLGLGWYFSVLLFFLAVGLFRNLKKIPKLSPILYRVLHFALCSVVFYLCFFPLQSALTASFGEAVGTTDFGSVNWRSVIFSYAIFLFAYFITVGLRALAYAKQRKRARQNAEYKSMVK